MPSMMTFTTARKTRAEAVEWFPYRPAVIHHQLVVRRARQEERARAEGSEDNFNDIFSI